MVWATLVGQPGNNLEISRVILSDEIAIILGASLRFALTTQSAPFVVRPASRLGLFERDFRNQRATTAEGGLGILAQRVSAASPLLGQ